MRTLLVLALFGLVFSQADSISELVEKLGAENVADREEAVRKLKALGKAAAPPLRNALASNDGETRSRAKYLLRIIDLSETLPASLLKEFPSAPELLASSSQEWTALFLKTAERMHLQVPGVAACTLGKSDLEALVTDAVRGARTPEERAAVSDKLWTYRLRGALPALVELLKSPSLELQVYACSCLGALDESPSIATSLLPLLQTPETCAEASGALLKHGYWKVVPEILSLLSHKDPRVRANAAEMAARLRIREALPAIHALAKDPDAEVRRDSYMARRECGDRESLEDLVSAAQDPDSGVRHAAAFALVNGREPQAIRAITDWIENPQNDRLAYAVPAAGKLRLREAVPGLLRLIKTTTPNHRDDTVSEAAFALAEIGDPASIAALRELLSQQSANVRKYALQALGGLGAREALPDMEVLLKDKESSVREQAVLTIVEVGGKTAIPKILALVQDPQPGVRAACADALRKSGARDHGAILFPILKDANGLVSGRAFWAVRVLKPEGAAEVLLGLIGELGWELPYTLAEWGVGDQLPRVRALLSDPRPKVRCEAAIILGLLQDTASVPALKDLLKDRNPEVRSIAVSTLARLHAEGAFEAIAPLLDDPETRRGAIGLLGFLGPKALPLLEKLLLDPDPHNREWIIRGPLVQAGQKEAIPLLLRSLDDPEDTIRTMALWQLVIELDARPSMPAIISKLEKRSGEQWGWLAYYSAIAGSAEPMSLILEKSRASSAEDRVRVIQAVSQVKARDCVSVLIETLKDPSPTVAGAAAEALGELDVSEAIPGIRSLLQHRSVAARHGAARALCQLGERDGARILVEEHGTGQFLINRLREPAMWKRLSEIPIPEVPGGSLRDRLPKLSASIGIPIDLCLAAWGHPDYLDNSDRWWSRKGKTSVLDVLRSIRSADVILESNRIRVLHQNASEILWREWWQKESRK